LYGDESEMKQTENNSIQFQGLELQKYFDFKSD